MSNWLLPALAAGATVGTLVWIILNRAFQGRQRELRAELKARSDELEARFERDAEAMRLQAVVAAREVLSKERSALEADSARIREELRDAESRLRVREEVLHRQMDRVASQDAEIRRQSGELGAQREEQARLNAELETLVLRQRTELERIAGLAASTARAELLKQVEQEAQQEAVELSRRTLVIARTNAEQAAREIIGIAIQRFAGKHTFETTTATVALSGDDMKGRIIGRDGRNIRAFEAATGVTVLVDDTPNAVVLSGFDPLRREIARQAMERLIVDGRIHPARIEEIVASVNHEMDSFVVRTGDEAVSRAGLPPLAPEVSQTLGKLHFRHSFSQNVLEHSVEVAHLCGLMAAELGEDIMLAKRSGLLHDIGKALSHEMEGPHAIVGAEFVRRHGESALIVNAVASHHDEVPHENIFGILVSAADAISASRPGSRSESMTTYIKRLENLEQIALEFEGVERAFAVQAGRELRVIVRPEAVDDVQSHDLARRMARRVEQELHYPGQIRITIIRETRCVEYAK